MTRLCTPLTDEFLTLCAPPRAGDRESFRENLSKTKNHFTNFSGAQDARGRRELRFVEISPLSDPWRHQKRQEKKFGNWKSKIFRVGTYLPRRSTPLQQQ